MLRTSTLQVMQSIDGDLEQQDSRGWTPIMWSSSNGYCKLVRQLVQRGADVHHIGQAKGGNGTTTALHECAAMRGEKNQPAEGYYETAWLLMAVGASPFTERSDGLTPAEVAATYGNTQMKTFLEGCCLFRGTLAMPVPQAFGSKIKNRYCTVQPRFPLGNAAPTLWMICYRNTNEVQPVCKIPLGNARVMIEGPQDSENGILIVPSSSKVPKGVHVRSHTSNSYIIEIRAVALAKMPGWKTLRTLADVCKAAGVAVSCRSLDQLCNAALAQAVPQMKLPGQGIVPELDRDTGEMSSKVTITGELQRADSALKPTIIKEEKPGQIADSAQDMVAPSSTLTTQQSLDQSEPSTPRLSDADSSAPPRRSGIGSLFKAAFRKSSSTAPSPRKYNSGLLDSSSSLGQMSCVSQHQEPAKKGGLFGFKRKNSTSHGPPRISMPSITEQSAGGLTEADISAFSQPIPDKFWSKMGRKMSTQRQSRPAQAGYKANVQSWFHDDEGTVSSTGLSSPKPSKKDFEEEDLNDLMYPAGAPRPSVAGSQPRAPRGQTGDNARMPQQNAEGFVLEEPILPTQKMVHAGPRRSFSFDDLDDMVSGGNRKARGHREDYGIQMATGHSPRHFQQASNMAGQGPRAFMDGPPPASIMRTGQTNLPRRSFSLHDLDQMLKPKSQDSPEGGFAEQQQAMPKRKGPAIDPNSYGGFQGQPAPEWRPYKPASARSIPAPAHGQLHAQPDPRQLPRQASGQMARQGSGNLHPSRVASGQHPQPLHTAPHPVHPQRPHPQALQNQQPHHQQLHPSQQQQLQYQQQLQRRQNSRANPQPGQPMQGHPHQSMPRQGNVQHPQPPHSVQPLPQVHQQTRPGQSAHAHPQQRSSSRSAAKEGVPPELAHLACLRALETGNLALPGLGAIKKSSSSLERTPSQSTPPQNVSSKTAPPQGIPAQTILLQSTPQSVPPKVVSQGNNIGAVASEQENDARGANASVVYESASTQKSTEAEDPVATKTPAKPQTEERISQGFEAAEETPASPPARPPSIAPAVPSVLFQGVKVPKNATPPTRIARERDEVPAIRHSGSHEFTSPRHSAS